MGLNNKTFHFNDLISLHKLKVLWFTNTPSLFTSKTIGKPVVEGSWISSLELLIREKGAKIDLNIAFFGVCEEIKMFEVDNVKYYMIPRAGKVNRWLRRIFLVIHSEKDIQNLLQVVEKVKPDLVHIFGTESVFGMISDKVTIPVLIQIQGIVNSFIPVYFGNLSLFTVIRFAGIKDFFSAGVLFRYLGEKKRAKRELATLKKAKYVMGRTDFDKSFVEKINPECRYYHLADVIRREFYIDKTFNERKSRFVIQTVIHAEYYKGLDLIFETFKRLKELSINFEWRIAGLSKDDPMVKTIRKATGFNEDEKDLVFMGKIGAELLAESMRESDLYIHTSFIENPSNAICEAMILGLPIIAANVGGTPSILENGVSGILYKAGNSEELVDSVNKLYNNPEYARLLGANAKQIALLRHDPESIYSGLTTIYAEVSGKPAGLTK